MAILPLFQRQQDLKSALFDIGLQILALNREMLSKTRYVSELSKMMNFGSQPDLSYGRCRMTPGEVFKLAPDLRASIFTSGDEMTAAAHRSYYNNVALYSSRMQLDHAAKVALWESACKEQIQRKQDEINQENKEIDARKQELVQQQDMMRQELQLVSGELKQETQQHYARG